MKHVDVSQWKFPTLQLRLSQCVQEGWEDTEAGHSRKAALPSGATITYKAEAVGKFLCGCARPTELYYKLQAPQILVNSTFTHTNPHNNEGLQETPVYMAVQTEYILLSAAAVSL